MARETIPLSLADFLARDQVALVMWDFQKGLAGKALHAADVIAAAQKLVAAADAAGVVAVARSRHRRRPADHRRADRQNL